MVRGRRTRPAASAALITTLNSTATTNGSTSTSRNFLEEYYASPKRKDYKLDQSVLNERQNSKISGTNKSEAVNNHHQLIENKFKTQMVLRGNKTKAIEITRYFQHVQKQEQTESIDIPQEETTSHDGIQLTDDDTCDSFTNQSQINHQHQIGYSDDKQHVVVGVPAFEMFATNSLLLKNDDNETLDVSSNIFLQEPVLKLNVDKSPNQPSSIIIKKTLDINPDFGHLTTHHFVSFNATETTPPIIKPEEVSKLTTPDSIEPIIKTISPTLINSDSNSCDSGVVVDKSLELSPGRHKKLTTPHRILCPSPVKNELLINSHNLVAGRDVENKIVTSNELLGKKVAKPRRRLNMPPVETPVSQLKNQFTTKVPSGTISSEKPRSNKIQTTSINMTTATVPKSCTQKSIHEFYKVRRSVRKTKKEVEKEEQRAIEQAIAEGREDGLAVRMFESKGRGIVAVKPFSKGDFVVEYIGDLISISEANKREQLYAEDQNAGCYMYYFKHKNKQYCIDATEETGKLGRLVNHSRNGNLITKTVDYKGHPHLVLIAKEDIESGKELTYDYGDRSKESLQAYPWLAL